MSVVSDMDLSAYSDLFKDVNGFRPRGQLLQFESMEEYNRVMDRLVEDLEQNMADEARREAEALKVLNARLAQMQADYGISRADALRWDMQADGEEDLDFYLWKQGLLSQSVVQEFRV